MIHSFTTRQYTFCLPRGRGFEFNSGHPFKKLVIKYILKSGEVRPRQPKSKSQMQKTIKSITFGKIMILLFFVF